MGRSYSSRRRPTPSCKKHPGHAAVKGTDLCTNCLSYEKLRAKIQGKDGSAPAARGAPKKAPSAVVDPKPPAKAPATGKPITTAPIKAAAGR